MTDKTGPGSGRGSGPAPAGYHTLVTFFPVNECAKAIEFYREVFGAQTVRRMDGPDGTVMHAELRIGDTIFQLSDPMPGYGILPPPAEGNNFTLMYWTPDPDAVFDKAVAHGATAIGPVSDVFSGDRMGVLRCPFGVRWGIGRHDRDVPDEEIEAAARHWVESEGS